MKLGVSTYALAWAIGVPNYEQPIRPLTPEAFLNKVGELGVRLVQIADNMPLHLMSDTELNNLKKTGDRLQMEIEIGTRGTKPNHLLNYLQIAKRLKSKFIRTIIDSTDLERAEVEIKTVLPHFVQEDVYLAIENHGLHTTKQLVDLLTSINSPYVGVCIDTVNSFSALESQTEVIERLHPYIINLHVKDFEIKRIDHQMGFVVTGTPAGSGRLDIDNIIELLKREEKDYTTITLELWPPFTNSVEETIQLEESWLHQSIHYLKMLNLS